MSLILSFANMFAESKSDLKVPPATTQTAQTTTQTAPTQKFIFNHIRCANHNELANQVGEEIVVTRQTILELQNRINEMNSQLGGDSDEYTDIKQIKYVSDLDMHCEMYLTEIQMHCSGNSNRKIRFLDDIIRHKLVDSISQLKLEYHMLDYLTDEYYKHAMVEHQDRCDDVHINTLDESYDDTYDHYYK